MGNSWPHFHAQAYGRVDKDNATHFFENAFDLTHNRALWFGPWAGGMVVTGSQLPADLDGKSWQDDAEQIVVHAMADGEWGGVQFAVSNATFDAQTGDTTLVFSKGGWQQARGATMNANNNRYYMEGSLGFLDVEGEWHFDPATRTLYIVPPAGVDSAAMASLPLVLTQTDVLFRLVGSGDGTDSSSASSASASSTASSSSTTAGLVQHIVVENMTFTETSASFFIPHEESSGGDYAVARSAAVFVENATSITIQSCDLRNLGGNGVFLSNYVRSVDVRGNHFSHLGTSGVLLVGRTGASLMDAQDGGEGGEGDNGGGGGGANARVRLPRGNTVSHNVFHDYGIWDKQSAAYHKALAPGNKFTNNVVFNASRHGVNFQDSMGGAGVVDGNVFFSLNRETKDTAALNSWGRRPYLFNEGATSNNVDANDTRTAATPPTAHLIPSQMNSWRNNLILARQIDPNTPDAYRRGNCLRCDDGASW